MHVIVEASHTQPAHRAAIIGDEIAITGDDRLVSTLEVTERPEASAAVMDGPILRPDVPGRYTVQASTGTRTSLAVVHVFSLAAHAGISRTVIQGNPHHSDEKTRAILGSLCRHGMTVEDLATFNAGGVPIGLSLAQYGAF